MFQGEPQVSTHVATANNANFSTSISRACRVFFFVLTYTIALVLGGFWP